MNSNKMRVKVAEPLSLPLAAKSYSGFIKPLSRLSQNKSLKITKDKTQISIDSLCKKSFKDECTNFLSSSESSTMDSMECASSFKDLIRQITLKLRDIEREYSLDNFFNCLRYHLNLNGYGSVTVKMLENFLRPSRSSMEMTKNTINPYLTYGILQSIPKFFKLFHSLKHTFQVAQRDLLFNVLSKDLNGNQSQFKVLLKQSKSNLNDGFESPPLELSSQTGEFTLESRESKVKMKICKKLFKYQQALYGLNERLTLLLNDTSSANIKLLSNETKLAKKYEFFRNAEYLLRLIPDIVFKMRCLLKFCKKSHETNEILNEKANKKMDEQRGALNIAIKEIDGSIKTDDESSYYHRLPQYKKVLPPIQTKNQESHDIYEEYLAKSNELNDCQAELNKVRQELKILITRREHFSSIESKIKSLTNLIAQAEKNLSETNDATYENQLEHELTYVRYCLNMESQNFEREKLMENDTFVAIKQANAKLKKTQLKCYELNEQLIKLNNEIDFLYKDLY